MNVRALLEQDECLFTENINELTLVSIDDQTNLPYMTYYYEIKCNHITDVEKICCNGDIMTPDRTIDKGDFILVVSWKHTYYKN